jgi:hypothetical protein
MTYQQLIQAATDNTPVELEAFLECIKKSGFSNGDGIYLCYWRNGEPSPEHDSWNINRKDNTADWSPRGFCEPSYIVKLIN